MEARGAGERRLAVHDLDAVALAQCPDPGHQTLYDGRLPLLEPDHVDFDGPRLHAALHRVLDRLDEVRGVDERLARDAAVVQAFAAELVALHEEDALAQLRRAYRRRIAAGSRSDHDDVDLAGHGRSMEPLLFMSLLVGLIRCPRKSWPDAPDSSGPPAQRPRRHDRRRRGGRRNTRRTSSRG